MEGQRQIQAKTEGERESESNRLVELFFRVANLVIWHLLITVRWSVRCVVSHTEQGIFLSRPKRGSG